MTPEYVGAATFLGVVFSLAGLALVVVAVIRMWSGDYRRGVGSVPLLAALALIVIGNAWLLDLR